MTTLLIGMLMNVLISNSQRLFLTAFKKQQFHCGHETRWLINCHSVILTILTLLACEFSNSLYYIYYIGQDGQSTIALVIF